MILYFDGGCKPNPGKMEVAVAIERSRGKYDFHHHRLDHGTNNQAEWLALLLALSVASQEGADNITIYGDSKLVINQALGQWKCSEPLQPFLAEYKALRKAFTSVKLLYVPRAQNVAGNHIESVN